MIDRMKELIDEINHHKDLYYNKNQPIISDQEFDKLVDELEQLEKDTGIVLSSSPTQTVGYKVQSALQKVKHSHPMLSLAKTKNLFEFASYCGNKPSMISLKMDGLTVLLTYENGELMQAETRGNGEIGELITANAKVFDNIPLKIPYKEHFEIEGEAIITYSDFKKINEKLSVAERYSNPRNLASGSVRQLDPSVTAKRHVKFIAWKVPYLIDESVGLNPNNFADKLKFASGLGFTIVPYFRLANNSAVEVKHTISDLKDWAASYEYPYDGFVQTFLDVKYGESLGYTGHHPKHSFVLKEQDTEVETVLREIVWQVGKSAQITPVAVFDPVEVEGSIVEKASVHNISILTKLELIPGDIITVYKANQIIPQIRRNLTAETTSDHPYVRVPAKCPVCGGVTKIQRVNDSDVLICTNPNCKGKLLGKLKHFCSKDAMDIQGLSEQTLQKFINLNYINSIPDLYDISMFQEELRMLDGFGAQSVKNLLDALENSKHTTLDRFINALSIPNIGKETAKVIAKAMDYNWIKFGIACNTRYNWQKLPDFGAVMERSLIQFWGENREWVESLGSMMDFYNPNEGKVRNDALYGKNIVITGKLHHFKNRDELVKKIEEYGGKVSGSVSKNTDYLINNDITSNSGKNKKAKELGVKIITEEQFLGEFE